MKKNILMTGLAFLALTLLSFYQAFDMKASVERGKALYEAQCTSCHMTEGEGVEGAFPPLAKSNSLADKNRLVKIIVLGTRGPMKVKGKDYDGEMAGISLTDQEVSDVLNYIRNSWGNKGAAIRPAEIQPALKAKTPNYQPF